MVLEITIPSILSFAVTATLLLIYAVLDLRTRLVPNQVMIAGGLTGFVIVVLTGHLIDQAVLHLSAGVFMVLVAYSLFRTGAFGGADMKAVVTVAMLSPGIEFASWSDPILEGVLGSGLLLVAVLLGAYLFSRYRPREEGARITPLLPVVLAAYILLQLLAVA
jgi:Flp pilus assembly protein protease CpaA